MRGSDEYQGACFSYISLEDRVPGDHPLRPIRKMLDKALEELSGELEKLYARSGRPSIPPERLLRALLLQVLFSVRSERQLMEQMDYNLLFRWFVGLGVDDPVWHPTTFTKNRDRLLKGEIAQKLRKRSRNGVVDSRGWLGIGGQFCLAGEGGRSTSERRGWSAKRSFQSRGIS